MSEEFSDDLLLLTLRLGGVLSVPELCQRTGLSAERCIEWLTLNEQRGLTVERFGVLAGWSTTAQGRRVAAHRAHLSVASVPNALDRLVAAYVAFGPLNTEVLTVCSRWQVIQRDDGELVRNDHGDVGYDAKVLAELEEIHVRARAVGQDFAAIVERFRGYVERLDRAVGLTLGGDHDWFCRPGRDSYHSVWFELHEDLLCSLGRTRNDEVAGGAVRKPPR